MWDFVKTITSNSSIWPKLATSGANYQVLGFQGSFQQNVPTSLRFCEKPSKLSDLAETSNFSCKLPCFRVLMKFSTKSVGFWEKPSIHIDLRETSNFPCKLPCFRIFIKFSKQQLAKVCIKDIKVGCVEISPSSSVKNLGVRFDSSLNMSEHITKLCASAFFHIYNIRHIRKYLSRESAET